MSTSSTPAPGSKPISIKVEPWTDFPRLPYTIHNDDFCHSKPFVAKFTAKGSRSTLNVKETVSKKEGNFKTEDDVKLWFDLPDSRSFYARVKSSDYIKLHYDNGMTQWNGKNWNLYGTFWSDRSFSKTSVRIGAGSYHEKCQSDNRLKINAASGSNNFYWYNRTLSFIKNWKFGIVSVVDLSNKVLQKNNLLLAYKINNQHEAFLRFENEGYRSSNPRIQNISTIWDTVTANYIGSFNKTIKVGVEASFNIDHKEIQKVEAVVEKQIPDQQMTLKAKVNSKYDVAFLFKRSLWGFENLVTLSAGLGVSNINSDKRAFQHGIQVDFNI